MLTSLAQYVPNLPDSTILNSIIVLGWGLSILINIVVNAWILIAWAFKKGPVTVPWWLVIVNFIFLVVQLIIIFFHT